MSLKFITYLKLIVKERMDNSFQKIGSFFCRIQMYILLCQTSHVIAVVFVSHYLYVGVLKFNYCIESKERQSWASFFFTSFLRILLQYTQKYINVIWKRYQEYGLNVTGTLNKVTIPRIIANKQHRSIGGYVCCKNKIQFSYLLTVFFAILTTIKNCG